MSTDKIVEHYEKNFKKLVKKFTFKTGTEWAAQDVVQDAYANSLKYLKSFKEDGEFNKWFNAILNNCFSDWRNKERGVTPPDPIDEEPVELSSGLLEDVNRLIARESPEHQEILKLHFSFDYSAQDISMITYHSYANAYKVIQRFKRGVKELYEC